MPKIFLPSVFGFGELPCGMNALAARFASSWLTLLGDRVHLYRCDRRLVVAAQRQAEWLAINDFEEGSPHNGEGGNTANQRVREAGYRLPTWQGNENTVESVTHTPREPEDAAVSLTNHDTHREHMLGLGWYEDSVVYGTGCALSLARPDSPSFSKNHFFVHIIAIEEGE